MNVFESIKQALNSVIVNKLRAGLTLLSISIGIFAIIAFGSMVDSLNYAVEGEMAELGENSFAIYRIPKINFGGQVWKKYRKRKPITLSQAEEFESRMTLTSMISLQSSTSGKIVKFGKLETDPDVNVIGVDDDYFITNNITVESGRGFSRSDINFNKKVALIGPDVQKSIFPGVYPIGKEIRINNQKYEVIGILAEKGAILGSSQDNQVIVPISDFLNHYAERWEESLQISVRANSKEELYDTIDEAIGIMRVLRDTKPWEENSFELETNESLSAQFSDLTKYLQYLGLVIGVFSLIAAGIGIMNIMLVSVKERTREIGVRKAVGAKKVWILLQFIIESVTLCQLGGIFGILLGILVVWLFGMNFGLEVSLPFTWIIVSVIFCTLIGVFFGAYPAWKAAQLDPIDALRYE